MREAQSITAAMVLNVKTSTHLSSKTEAFYMEIIRGEIDAPGIYQELRSNKLSPRHCDLSFAPAKPPGFIF